LQPPKNKTAVRPLIAAFLPILLDQADIIEGQRFR